MMVYRVQDAEGRGPYRPGFSHRWADSDGPIMLPFYEEFGWSLTSIPGRFLPGEFAGCGFRALDHLYRWFSPTECQRLSGFGYVIVFLYVDRVLAESAHQVVFARRRPLTDGIVITPWRGVLDAAR